MMAGAACVATMPLGGCLTSPDNATQSVLAQAVAHGQIPGAVSLIRRDGRLEAEVVGLRDVESGTPMTRDTIFRIASMTKPITAVAVLMLVDDGKIGLDAPIEKWLPELGSRRVLEKPGARLEQTRPAARSLTARDLLTYRAGYTHWAFLDPSWPIAKAMRQAGLGSDTTLNLDIEPEEFLKRLGELPMIFDPGEVWQYQTPSEILGILVLRAAGKSLPDFFQERIFGPLSMVDTDFHVPPSSIDRFASAYGPAPNGLVKIDDPATSPWRTAPRFPSGAGGLVSTADDYLRFAGMLLDGGTYRGRRLLSKQSLSDMTRNYLTDAQRAPRAPLNPALPMPRENRFDRDGFGLGVSVAVKQLPGDLTIGSYGWDGLYGSEWNNDSQAKIARVLMMQVQWAGLLFDVGARHRKSLYTA